MAHSKESQVSLLKDAPAEFDELAEELLDGTIMEKATYLNLREETRITENVASEFHSASIASAHSDPTARLHDGCRCDPAHSMTERPTADLLKDAPADLAHFRTDEWLEARGYLSSAAPGVPTSIKIDYRKKLSTAPCLWCAFGEDSGGDDILDLIDGNEIVCRLGLVSPGTILRRIPVTLDPDKAFIPTSLSAACSPPFHPRPAKHWGQTRDLRDDVPRYKELILEWNDLDCGSEALYVSHFDLSGLALNYLHERVKAL